MTFPLWLWMLTIKKAFGKLGEIEGDIKINEVDPGWVSSDMGGLSAPRTPEQAAASILWLATIGAEGPNGKFFRDGEQIVW